MSQITMEEALDALVELAEILPEGAFTGDRVKDFKEAILEGLTIEQAQERVVWNNTY